MAYYRRGSLGLQPELLNLILMPILRQKNVSLDESILHVLPDELTAMLENKTLDLLALTFQPTAERQQAFAFTQRLYDVQFLSLSD